MHFDCTGARVPRPQWRGAGGVGGGGWGNVVAMWSQCGPIYIYIPPCVLPLGCMPRTFTCYMYLYIYIYTSVCPAAGLHAPHIYVCLCPLMYIYIYIPPRVLPLGRMPRIFTCGCVLADPPGTSAKAAQNACALQKNHQNDKFAFAISCRRSARAGQKSR